MEKTKIIRNKWAEFLRTKISPSKILIGSQKDNPEKAVYIQTISRRYSKNEDTDIRYKCVKLDRLLKDLIYSGIDKKSDIKKVMDKLVDIYFETNLNNK